MAGEDSLTDERQDFLQPSRRAPWWESSPRLLTHTHHHSLAMTAPLGTAFLCTEPVITLRTCAPSGAFTCT